VAVHAARGLLGPSRRRARDTRAREARWLAYLLAGTASAALIGPYLVLVLLACGLLELVVQRGGSSTLHRGGLGALVPGSISAGGLGALPCSPLTVGARPVRRGARLPPP